MPPNEASDSFPHEMPMPDNPNPLAEPHQHHEVTSSTGLGPLLKSIIHRRNSFFGHVARLAEDISAQQALRCYVHSVVLLIEAGNFDQSSKLDQLRGTTTQHLLISEMSHLVCSLGLTGDAMVLAELNTR